MASAFPDDIIVEAQPENNPTEEGRASDNTFSANGNRPSNPMPTIQPETSIRRKDAPKYEELVKKLYANKLAFLSHFKPKVDYVPIDIAILHAAENRKEAATFRDSILKNEEKNKGDCLKDIQQLSISDVATYFSKKDHHFTSRMESHGYKTQDSLFPSQSPTGVDQTDKPVVYSVQPLHCSSTEGDSCYSHTIPTSVNSSVDELKGNETNQISEVQSYSKWDIENDIDLSYPGSLKNVLRAPTAFLKSFQEEGSAEAARLLSTYYKHVGVLKQDLKKAAYLLRYAAERGKVSAMCQLHDLLIEYKIKPLNNECMDHWKKEASKRGAYWFERCEEEEEVDSEAEVSEDEVVEEAGQDLMQSSTKAFRRDSDFKDGGRPLVF